MFAAVRCAGVASRVPRISHVAIISHHPQATLEGDVRRHGPAATPKSGTSAVRLRPDHRAISGPLTPVTSGLSRSLADTPPRRSGHVTGPDGTDSQADSATSRLRGSLTLHMRGRLLVERRGAGT